MFNFHTYQIDEVPCLLNVDIAHVEEVYPAPVRLSVGIHPWHVTNDWQKTFTLVRAMAMKDSVWAIGECGLDKVRGEALSVQTEAFKAHVALAEEVGKPMVIHCVRAYNEILSLREQLEKDCQQEGKQPQPWVIHGFRGKPQLAKQLMTKGFLLSFGHLYNVESLRFVFTSGHPFFLETDDLPLSVHQIYEQVAHHLCVDVSLLENLCDPRYRIFQNFS